MVNQAIQWSEKSVINSFILWLVLLVVSYIAFYPIYYFVAIGYVLVGTSSIFVDWEMWKCDRWRRSMLGFTAAVLVTLYVFTYHFSPFKWWAYFFQ